jgi:aldehyde dehydrogenase (NAD+)
MTHSERRNLILDLARQIELNASDLAYLESLENGKPYEFCKYTTAKFEPEVLRYYAGWVDKIRGSTIPMDGPYQAMTFKEPVGVCG